MNKICKFTFQLTTMEESFQITTEFTRNQQMDAMTHESYMVTDAPHPQEKLPKYAPVFVAVSLNEN